MPTLYEIANELVDIDRMLDESGGEITDDIEAALAGLQGDFVAKAESIVRWYREEVARADRRVGLADPIQQEADRLMALAKVNTNKAKSLKAYLHRELQRVGMDRIETDFCKVWRQQNGGRPSIQWTGDVAAMPTRLKRTTVELDTTAAYEEWKREGKLPDGFEVNVGEHVRIS